MPVFGLALAVLGLALLLWPGSSPPTADLARQELDEALEALEAGDYRRAIALAERGLERKDLSRPLPGDLRFVLGSACLLEAAQVGEADRAELYSRARAFLQQAEQHGVSPQHEPRLTYRLTLAQYHTGADPDRVAQILERNLDVNPADAVEGYTLLISLYLDRSRPRLQAALRANEKLLAQPDLARPNPARLQRGELLMRLQRTEEARDVLALISADAPEYAAARHLYALSLFQDEQWQAAAELWEEAIKVEARTSQGVGAPSARSAFYHIGLCYRKLVLSDDAARTWEHVYREAPTSDEAWAASLQLARLRQEQGLHVEAMGYYESALRSLDPAVFRNEYLNTEAVRRLVESGWVAWFEAKEFDHARRLAELSRPLAADGEGERRVAQASEAAGLQRLQQAEQATKNQGDELLQQAQALFSDAAEAFEATARQRDGQADYGDLLWAAAENYLRAQRYTQAANVLDRYLALDIPEKRRLEALAGLGEAHHALKHTEQAVKVLKQALSGSGPASYRARYHLALAQMEQGHFDDAEKTLRDILNAPVQEAEPKQFRQSLFALGQVLWRRGQYIEAATHLEKAVEQYPRDPQVSQARYLLAESYRQAARLEAGNLSRADTMTAQQFYQKQRDYRLQQALAHYRQLAFDLTDRLSGETEKRRNGETGNEEVSVAVSPSRRFSISPLEEQELLRESRFGVGECLFNLGRYDEAVSVYDALAESYRGKAESLTASMQIIRCYWSLGNMAKAQKTIDWAMAALAEMDDKELQPPQLSRQEWQQWLDQAKSISRKKSRG